MNVLKSYLFGEVNYQSVQDVIQDIDNLNASKSYKSLQLSLCSFGGFSLPAFALYDSIKNSKKGVEIIATGTCQSSALLILQAGHTRYATAHTLFMIHHLKGCIEKSNYDEYIIETEQFRKESQLFIELTIRRSTLSMETFVDLCKKSPYLTPQEALTHNLIDNIL